MQPSLFSTQSGGSGSGAGGRSAAGARTQSVPAPGPSGGSFLIFFYPVSLRNLDGSIRMDERTASCHSVFAIFYQFIICL